jgi:hypothetical protein
MSRFRTYLSDVLSKNDWTQQHLAGLLDTDQASVSRWISGRSVPDRKSLGALIRVLPQTTRGPLLAAYLMDLVPDGCENTVSVSHNGASKHAGTDAGGPEFPSHIEPNLKKQLVYFAKLASGSHEVRRLISLLHGLLTKKGAKLLKGL